jgi:hypothetical protein
MMSERIEGIRQAVETMHECEAVHEGSTPVIEMFRQQIAWEGVVEAFALSGHPKAKRCYAWSYRDAGGTQYVTVLELPPGGFSDRRREGGNRSRSNVEIMTLLARHFGASRG